ncbi:hypothetical protein [Leptolyngbya sp. FACHB-17]|nr:hypothetical protein [Leptolyngbya sp. FACHB-17]MBD2080711.1 hypothetical protein [Leptolyngbya sp. FACHB-17]
MLVSDKHLLLIHINLFAVLLDRFLHQCNIIQCDRAFKAQQSRTWNASNR